MYLIMETFGSSPTHLQPLSGKFFDILENKMLDEYLTYTDHNFENHTILVGLKKCGRVTTTRITNSSF